MTLVVETGAGLANADSYVSTDNCAAYATDRGLIFAVAGSDLALAEQALRRATVWLDATYRDRYLGWRKLFRAQALEWPRTGALDNSTIPQVIQPDEVPVEIVRACCEAAVYEKANPGGLSPTVIASEIVQSLQAGSVRVDYGVTGRYGKSVNASDFIPVMNTIDNILVTLIQDAGGASIDLLRV